MRLAGDAGVCSGDTCKEVSIEVALDELHARRLETLVGLFEDALDRIDTVLRAAENKSEATAGRGLPTTEQICRVRECASHLRSRLDTAVRQFGIERREPDWRQAIVAELSTLWIVLENADPKRMSGYGREFAPEDEKDWKSLLRRLSREVDQMRGIVLADGTQ